MSLNASHSCCLSQFSAGQTEDSQADMASLEVIQALRGKVIHKKDTKVEYVSDLWGMIF